MRRIGRLTAALAIIAPHALASQARVAGWRATGAHAVARVSHSTSPSTRPSSRSSTPSSIDGTGTPAKNDQTILIRGEKIAAVGPVRERHGAARTRASSTRQARR